jgi:small subunit ribosomal protein S27Ae
MPAPEGGSTKEKKGKKPHKNKPTSKKYAKYSIEGNSLKKAKMCPRCSGGIFLAVHKDRLHCGKCNYTEFSKKA